MTLLVVSLDQFERTPNRSRRRRRIRHELVLQVAGDEAFVALTGFYGLQALLNAVLRPLVSVNIVFGVLSVSAELIGWWTGGQGVWNPLTFVGALIGVTFLMVFFAACVAYGQMQALWSAMTPLVVTAAPVGRVDYLTVPSRRFTWLRHGSALLNRNAMRRVGLWLTARLAEATRRSSNS